MKIFVTGATGFIGTALSLVLADKGHTVHALYRSPGKASALSHSNIRLFKGDILDRASLTTAMEGCAQIYHTAAFTGKWENDISMIERLNVEGCRIIYELALEKGLRDIVFTSTAGVYGPSIHGVTDENTRRTIGFFTHYERTKAEAEELSRHFVALGLNIRMVNPTRVYGPGPLNDSNSVTLMIKRYAQGRWRLIPGDGKSIGNYAFVDDVVNGHMQAMQHGKAGEKYLLGGENIDFNSFFDLLARITGEKRRMIHVPVFAMKILAGAATTLSRITNQPPLITRPLVQKYTHHWETSSEKARRELGYQVTPLEDGIRQTLLSLQ